MADRRFGGLFRRLDAVLSLATSATGETLRHFDIISTSTTALAGHAAMQRDPAAFRNPAGSCARQSSRLLQKRYAAQCSLPGESGFGESHAMPAKFMGILKKTAWVVLIFLCAAFVIRAWESQRRIAPLQPWHTYVPVELTPKAMDASDWQGYLQHEAQLFKDVEARMAAELDDSMRVATNRYNPDAPMHPGNLSRDWNRSYTLDPVGPPRGVAVMLHGLTDGPYSLRHVANRYQANGFTVVSIRMPGHGTVPGGLTDAGWEDWMAATRLAVREARRRAGNDVPLHVVGYSNGGALAMKYALDAIEDPTLARPDKLVLVSPMIGLTRFARFAGVASWPAVFPAFAKAAWLGVVPEYNPFKYNSFPVNAARESFLLTNVLRTQMARLEAENRLGTLAPVLTFQSILDTTVSTPSIMTDLYAKLPANGSEVVLFDVNRSLAFSPLLRPSAYSALQATVPVGPQRFRTTVIANAGEGQPAVVERSIDADATTATTRALGVDYPAELFSLSHIAMPFPSDDALYGITPTTEEDFGIHLGAVAPRGERGALVLDLNGVFRISSNPFLPYLLEKMEADMAPGSAASASPVKTGTAQAKTVARAALEETAEDYETSESQETP
jgi:alpha-beta hydrolase superfamily lysophospholipase